MERKLLNLPKTRRDPKETEHLCKCRPVCKSRRRVWKDQVQPTSAELLLARKPVPDCFRRCPTKVHPNHPCPLFAKTNRVTLNIRGEDHKTSVVRVCQAPLDVHVNTPYLEYAELAKTLGAWKVIEKQSCGHCLCGSCCPCVDDEYEPNDAERERSALMRTFDTRVARNYQDMRIMYDTTRDP